MKSVKTRLARVRVQVRRGVRKATARRLPHFDVLYAHYARIARIKDSRRMETQRRAFFLSSFGGKNMRYFNALFSHGAKLSDVRLLLTIYLRSPENRKKFIPVLKKMNAEFARAVHQLRVLTFSHDVVVHHGERAANFRHEMMNETQAWVGFLDAAQQALIETEPKHR